MTQEKLKLSLQQRWASSALDAGNAEYLEQLYHLYLENPESVDQQWRDYFSQMVPAATTSLEQSHETIKDEMRRLVEHRHRHHPASPEELHHKAKQVQVLQLINAYRFRGHQWAKIDPLEQREIPDIPDLRLDYHNLDDEDCDTVYNTGSLAGPETATLSEIVAIVQSTYCGSIGSEYMHITNTLEKRWIQDYLETPRGQASFSNEVKVRILKHLSAAEGLEHYLHSKYVGQKRFSLEGGESLIPMLSELIHRGGTEHGIEEMAIGMAHRGRLNVLVNIMGKTPAELFKEFEGKVSDEDKGTGDVKYHMGFSSDIVTEGALVHVALAFNPSHLEIVSPVVEGSVRARQDRRQDKNGKLVLPILIHGDAALAGQGVVMETINMSQSRGYSTKGTIHIVINNQIGFTTSNLEDARSTMYCTDIAKMVNAPIFHVNGDDPEAVLFVTQLAIDYRMMFAKDVVIDLVCYRRHGHSEADEPLATQPVMYQRIRQMPTTREAFAKKLLDEAVLTTSEVERMASDYRSRLEAGKALVEGLVESEAGKYPYFADWSPYLALDCLSVVETQVERERLERLYRRLEILPEDFTVHPNVRRILENRSKMLQGEIPIDWGFAETMAYATLVDEGFNVRLSGQDCGRGTFFHRHAVLHNQKDGSSYVPLRNLSEDQGNFLPINSLLSEEAVLAFEYGYATTDPTTLTIWEAQFGDFANNAQVVIDQFISAGEQKWNRLCGLVMFLPHGVEGQGPEHSSARLERYLQLCAQHNMLVCVPTTAAQIFHLLRRQMLMSCRRPLIVMTPKSMLRNPVASSSLEALTGGQFHRLIPEIDELDDAGVKRILLCSGKVYYDLLERRRKDERYDVAIIRLEQLYPFPDVELKRELARYPQADEFIWCQEEPMNQGAWYSSQHHMRAAIGKQNYLHYAGRPLLAAPAVGYLSLHKKQLQQLVDDAFGPIEV